MISHAFFTPVSLVLKFQVLLFVSLAADLLRVKNVAGLAVDEGDTGKMRAAADCEGCSILDELGERTCGGEVFSLGCSQWYVGSWELWELPLRYLLLPPPAVEYEVVGESGRATGGGDGDV